jgi:hypothetical protein
MNGDEYSRQNGETTFIARVGPYDVWLQQVYLVVYDAHERPVLVTHGGELKPFSEHFRRAEIAMRSPEYDILVAINAMRCGRV